MPDGTDWSKQTDENKPMVKGWSQTVDPYDALREAAKIICEDAEANASGEDWQPVYYKQIEALRRALEAAPERSEEGGTAESRWLRADQIAQVFHEAYESFAPQYGYETREESRVPWDQVPSKNRALMGRVVIALMEQGIIEAVAPLAGAKAPNPSPVLEAVEERATQDDDLVKLVVDELEHFAARRKRGGVGSHAEARKLIALARRVPVSGPTEAERDDGRA